MSKPSENLRQRKGLLNEEHDDEVFQLRNIFMKSVMYFLPEAIDELEADFEKFQTADSHLDSVMKQIDNWTRKWNIHHDWAIDFVKLVFEQGVTLLELQPGQSSIWDAWSWATLRQGRSDSSDSDTAEKPAPCFIAKRIRISSYREVRKILDSSEPSATDGLILKSWSEKSLRYITQIGGNRAEAEQALIHAWRDFESKLGDLYSKERRARIISRNPRLTMGVLERCGVLAMRVCEDLTFREIREKLIRHFTDMVPSELKEKVKPEIDTRVPGQSALSQQAKKLGREIGVSLPTRRGPKKLNF